MEFSIKTILRILFVLSCASLQAMDRSTTDPRNGHQPIDYTRITFLGSDTNNSTNSSTSSQPNTNPRPPQDRRADQENQ